MRRPRPDMGCRAIGWMGLHSEILYTYIFRFLSKVDFKMDERN
jgi:hypothetical protein